MNWIAHLTILTIGLVALAGDARASEPRTTASHAWLHWSEPKKIESPDHAWELAVFPIYNASENRTPVVVRKRFGTKSNLVLTLRRSADIYWGGARRLLIIDHPVANTSHLLLFRLEPTGDVRRLRTTPDLDVDVRDRVLGALGRTDVVPFYLPTFAAWTGSGLVLMVGGSVTYKSTAPSMSPYCYRVTVDSRTAKVESMAKELARDGRTKCQNFP